MEDYKEYLVKFIRRYQYYASGVLEKKSEEELKEIYESLLNWIG